MLVVFHRLKRVLCSFVLIKKCVCVLMLCVSCFSVCVYFHVLCACGLMSCLLFFLSVCLLNMCLGLNGVCVSCFLCLVRLFVFLNRFCKKHACLFFVLSVYVA